MQGETMLLNIPGLPGVVKRAEITFDIYTGEGRQAAGKAQHSFSLQQQYFSINARRLAVAEEQASDEESWSLHIVGELGWHGLSPLQVSLREGKQGMSSRLVDLGELKARAGKEREWQVPDGLLDRQSLIYQFMVSPPSVSGGSLSLADGDRNLRYDYRVAGSDALPEGIAGLGRTLKLELRAAEGGSKELIELWLLPERRHLPVRVRYTDARGEVTEMVATSLDFEE